MHLLTQLIKIPSETRKEEELVRFLMDYLKEKGIGTVMQDGNIVIRIAGKDRSNALILNAHTDTVSAGGESAWKFPSLGGKEEDGKIYGLGASDDKASIVSFLLLAEYLNNHKPGCDVWITFVHGEETDGAGTRSFLQYFAPFKKNYKQVAGIVAEPTDCGFIELGHRGSVKIKLTVRGQSGHGSRPAEVEIQAIKEMVKALEKMEKIELLAQTDYADPILGKPTFALTGIYSNETSLNKIPNSCSSVWDIRTTPELHEKLIAFLQAQLGGGIQIENIQTAHPPVCLSAEEKIIRVFEKVLPEIQKRISPGANDSYLFIHAGIPAVTFGPGTKMVIHKENEYAEIEKINKAFEVYKKVIDIFSLQ